MIQTNAQVTALARHTGYHRVVYNWALFYFKEGLDKGEWHSCYDIRRAFNQIKRETYPWSAELSQTVSKQAIGNLDRAIKNWRNPRTKSKFPRMHKRSHKQSFQIDDGPDRLTIDGKFINFPRAIGRIRCRQELRFSGSIRKVIVVKEANRWFAYIDVEIVEPERFNLTNKPSIGVDVGIKTLATCSDGTVYENPKPLKCYQRKLRKLDKSIARSRNQHGSKNFSERRKRNLLKRAKVHQRIKNIRSDNHHKATSTIVKTASSVVVTEDVECLKVCGRIGNYREALSDVKFVIVSWLS